MLLSAATDNLTRADYEAPVYRNILDIVASVDYMNAQVFNSLFAYLSAGGADPGFLGFAANKTGLRDAFTATRLIVMTELFDVPDTPTLRAQITHDWGNLIKPYIRPVTADPPRVKDIIADLQDEIETLVRELNRVRLPLPTDLRNWARRMEDLSYKLPRDIWRPQGIQIAAGARPRWMLDQLTTYELCYQAHLMMGWIAQMRASLNKEIAKAGLKGKIGRIDLELTPSQRAQQAAAARATKSLFDPSRGAPPAPVKAAALTPAETKIAQVIKTQGVAAAVKRFGLAAVQGVQTKLSADLAPGSRLAPAAVPRAGTVSGLLWPAVAGAALLLFTL